MYSAFIDSGKTFILYINVYSKCKFRIFSLCCAASVLIKSTPYRVSKANFLGKRFGKKKGGFAVHRLPCVALTPYFFFRSQGNGAGFYADDDEVF